MISAATIAALEERGLEYILGARERGTAVIRAIVLENEKPFTPLSIPGTSPGMRACGETRLFVKEVTVGGARHIVCRNEAEAEKDRAVRLAIVDGLQRRLKQGDKALIANTGYRRYLRRSGEGEGVAFEIDAGKLAEEARYDGIFVLRTNARITPLNAVLRYRELLMVEALFRAAKATEDLVVPGTGPADLSFLRRRHPRPCLLLVPCAHPRQGAPGPLRQGRLPACQSAFNISQSANRKHCW